MTHESPVSPYSPARLSAAYGPKAIPRVGLSLKGRG